MKRIIIIAITIMLGITVSAEGWNQTIKRLKKENKELKARIVQLEKENKELKEQAQICDRTKKRDNCRNPRYAAYMARERAKLEKYRKEKKAIEEKIRNLKYRLGHKSKIKEERRKLLKQLKELDEDIKKAEFGSTMYL